MTPTERDRPEPSPPARSRALADIAAECDATLIRHLSEGVKDAVRRALAAGEHIDAVLAYLKSRGHGGIVLDAVQAWGAELMLHRRAAPGPCDSDQP